MAGGGFILGGLLSGLGAGMQNSFQQQREDALNALRAQNASALSKQQSDQEEARAAAHDDRTYKSSVGIEAMKAQGKLVTDKADAINTATYVEPAKAKTGIAVEQAKGGVQAQIETLKSYLDTQHDAASEKLKQQLGSGEVQSTEQAPDGSFVIVFKNGRVVTTKTKGLIKQPIDAFGGMLPTNAVPPAAAAPSAARGLLGATSPAPAAPPSPPAASAGKQVIDPGNVAQLYAQAQAKGAGGDPRYAGKSATQIKAMVDDMLRNKGYQLPN